MLAAIRIAGFEGRITLGLDVAGSNLRTGGGRYAVGGRHITAEEMVAYFVDLVQQYPLVFIEDPFDQDDFDSFAALTAALPDREIVGDDLFASNIHRLERGIRRRAGNTILLKANQIGTVTEVWDTGVMARENGVDVAVSIRSSDTNDPFVADLAVALHARQIKLGSPVRGERNAKYNRLLRIEEELGVQPLLGQPRPHTFSVVEPY
jgi:enolase